MTEIVITGLVRRKLLKRIVALNGDNQFEILHQRFIPPIINFVPIVEAIDPMFKASFSKWMRQLAIDGSKNLNLFFSFDWVGIKIKIKVDENFSLNSQLEIIHLDRQTTIQTYISKHVLRLGFGLRPNMNDSDYERVRNWSKYDLLLINGVIKDEGFSLPTTSQFLNPKLNERVYKFGKSHFPILQWAKHPMHSPPGIEVIQGRPYSINQSEIMETENSLVRFKKIISAKILHGSFVFSGGVFYFSDQLKVFSWGSLGNQWPSYLYAVADGNMISPTPSTYLPPLDTAIFIGGVNNLMHFAIEDVQKLSAVRSLGLAKEIPLLINRNLSPEIKGFLKVISGRDLVEIGESQEIEIRELYFPFFQNFLFGSISGDIKAAESLFNKVSYQYARQKLGTNKDIDSAKPSRVFIRRESGLFRPLLNAEKIQKMLEDKFGFVTHYVGNLTLDQATSIFHNAEIIVGEYGAGLAHMLLAPHRAKVLEIRGPLERNALEFEYLAKTLELEHSRVVGGAKYFSKKGIARGPYRVKPKVLESKIKELIERS
jgi:hypothetical protein